VAGGQTAGSAGLRRWQVNRVHTRSESDNPYRYGRYAFAWQHVPTGSAAHLDFGCGDGRFLRSLRARQIKCLVGLDVSREAIAQAQQASGGLEIVHVARATPLPFPDGTFSSITLLDVLEHIDEQEDLLDELYRVLSDDGVLIVTVPGRHAFSLLDLGNLKFRFPRLHRWYYCRTHSPQEYERRYVSNPDGLVGDVSAAKRWHEHFSVVHLARLLRCGGFDVAEFDGSGLFFRLLRLADMLAGRVGLLHMGIARLMAWDARAFASANLFCVARKRAPLPLKDKKDSPYDHGQAGHDLQTAGAQHVL
jgi:SAM-dependent methyltransferase